MRNNKSSFPGLIMMNSNSSINDNTQIMISILNNIIIGACCFAIRSALMRIAWQNDEFYQLSNCHGLNGTIMEWTLCLSGCE